MKSQKLNEYVLEYLERQAPPSGSGTNLAPLLNLPAQNSVPASVSAPPLTASKITFPQ